MPNDAPTYSNGLTTVAYAYSPSQAALKISALEGAGFDVFAPWFHTLANLQHHAIALGGLPLRVPSEQAQDARDLLLANEMADDTARETSRVTRAAPRSLFWKVVVAVVYYLTGTGPSMNVSFIASDRGKPGNVKVAAE